MGQITRFFFILTFLLSGPTFAASATASSCLSSCSKNIDCPVNTSCYQGSCRNPLCFSSNSCSCPATTPTPSPRPVYRPRPTTTPYPSYTASPLPSATPYASKPGSEQIDTTAKAACYQPCSSSDACDSNLICFNGYCRNPLCVSNVNCDCSALTSVTPSPTPAVLAKSTSMPPISLRTIGIALLWLIVAAFIIFILRRLRNPQSPTFVTPPPPPAVPPVVESSTVSSQSQVIYKNPSEMDKS